LESVVPKAETGLMVKKERRACGAFQAKLGYLDVKVHVGRKAQQVWACQVHPVDLVLAAFQGCKDHLAAEVPEGLMAALACLARRARMARMARMASMVNLAQMAKKDPMVKRDPKVTVAKVNCRYI